MTIRSLNLTLGLSVLAFAAACAPMSEAPVAPSPGDGPAQCKAPEYQRFVGRNRSELPAAPAGEVWRVVCSNCAMTMDYNPNRLNIVFDLDTGVISEVKCG